MKFAEKRIATLEATLVRTESELAGERDKRQSIAGEASAFKAINASQRAQLDELLRTALTSKPTAKKPARAAGVKSVAKVKPPAKEEKDPASLKKANS